MDFVPIHPDALRNVWGKIKDGLDAVQAKTPEDWIAEDVYHAIKSGTAQLVVAANDQGYAGFCVLRVNIREFSKIKDLHCWIGFNMGDADVFSAAESFIKQAALNAGCQKITFASRRKGWDKRYPMLTATYEVP